MSDKWYHKAVIEFEQKYQDVKPFNLKDFDGLWDVKGYCDNCNKKEVLLYYRNLKKSLCFECGNVEKEYYNDEMANMWELAHELLYHFKKLVEEVDNND